MRTNRIMSMTGILAVVMAAMLLPAACTRSTVTPTSTPSATAPAGPRPIASGAPMNAAITAVYQGSGPRVETAFAVGNLGGAELFATAPGLTSTPERPLVVADYGTHVVSAAIVACSRRVAILTAPLTRPRPYLPFVSGGNAQPSTADVITPTTNILAALRWRDNEPILQSARGLLPGEPLVADGTVVGMVGRQERDASALDILALIGQLHMNPSLSRC